MVKEIKKKLTFTESFCLAGILNAIEKTIMAPLERIKLILQCQGELLRQNKLSSGIHDINRVFDGLFDCFMRVGVSEGGYRFYRGNLCNVIRFFPSRALDLAFKDSFEYTFCSPYSPNTSYGRWLIGNIICGGLSGMCTLSVVYSFDYARTRLACDLICANKDTLQLVNSIKYPSVKRYICNNKHKSEFDGIMDVYVRTIKYNGLVGLYRGFWVSCFAIFIKQGIYYGLYPSLKPLLPEVTCVATPLKSLSLKDVNNDKKAINGIHRQTINGWEPSPSFLSGITSLSSPSSSLISSYSVSPSVYNGMLLTLGWFCTIAASFIAYPFDTVRRRMMVTCGGSYSEVNNLVNRRYRSSIHCFGSIFRTEGFSRGLMRGAGVNVITGVLGAFILVGFDKLKESYQYSNSYNL